MKNKQKTINFPLQISEEQLFEIILEVVEEENAAKFIAKLDTHFASWKVTTELIRHFKHIENVWKGECDNFGESYGDLSVKEIKF